jgi:hypothetical protein
MVRANLEQNGWALTRRGDELICKPAPLRAEKPKLLGKRLLRRISKDAAVAEFMKRLNAEVVGAEDLRN